jgi:hypothetical protein
MLGYLLPKTYLKWLLKGGDKYIVDKGWDWLQDAFPYRVDGVQKEEEWVVRKWNVWAKFNKIWTEKWKLTEHLLEEKLCRRVSDKDEGQRQ